MSKVEKVMLGVECCILYQNYVLLAKRSSTKKYFPNLLCFPGGKVEYGENMNEAVVREVKEECDVDIDSTKTELVNNSLNFHKDIDKIWCVNIFLGLY